MQKLLINLIKLYQLIISPYLGQSCRFDPTCSEYAQAAIAEYGIVKGIIFTLYRILRCQPFSKGGIDQMKKKDDSLLNN